MPDIVKRYWVHCRPTSPLLLGSRRGVGNLAPTLDFIPGTSFRGALARLYSRMPGSKDWTIFSSGIDFPDLTPTGAVPIPLSARTCKYHQGFRSGEDQHGVYDVLLVPRNAEMSCDLCGGELKRHAGWMVQNGGYSEPEVRRTAVGHTAIDIRTRTAAGGLYYLEENLRVRDRFIGELRTYGTPKPELERLLAQAKQDGLRIGHGKSRGMGVVSVELFDEAPDRDCWPPAEQRITRMQEKLRRAPGSEEDAAFSVTFGSRAILLDNYLRFRSHLAVSDLVEALEVSGGREAHPGLGELLSGFGADSRFTETAWVHGWSATSGMPKIPDLAVAAGACFLFVRRGKPLTGDEVAELARGMALLELHGVGERRAEGFGRVVFCDGFHWSQEHERLTSQSAGVGENYILH